MRVSNVFDNMSSYQNCSFGSDDPVFPVSEPACSEYVPPSAAILGIVECPAVSANAVPRIVPAPVMSPALSAVAFPTLANASSANLSPIFDSSSPEPITTPPQSISPDVRLLPQEAAWNILEAASVRGKGESGVYSSGWRPDVESCANFNISLRNLIGFLSRAGIGGSSESEYEQIRAAAEYGRNAGRIEAARATIMAVIHDLPYSAEALAKV
jgi:hypothetical protein